MPFRVMPLARTSGTLHGTPAANTPAIRSSAHPWKEDTPWGGAAHPMDRAPPCAFVARFRCNELGLKCIPPQHCADVRTRKRHSRSPVWNPEVITETYHLPELLKLCLLTDKAALRALEHIHRRFEDTYSIRLFQIGEDPMGSHGFKRDEVQTHIFETEARSDFRSTSDLQDLTTADQELYRAQGLAFGNPTLQPWAFTVVMLQPRTSRSKS